MNNLNLEVSLKPYYGLDAQGIRSACDSALQQWAPLLKHTDSVSVMFWAADGSEILDYAGDLDAEMEWARFIGNANPLLHPKIDSDPEGKSLHARRYLYREDALPISYRRFAEIIRVWREAIAALGKKPRIGLTFDPGGEFSPSSFKYERHREICLADTMGKASFVCCYGILNSDTHRYAGFPEGIQQNTSLGTFLGRQFTLFARDLGFDFIWFSNGFGFGMETWMTVGPLFDGQTFSPEKAPETRDKILGFWRDFRRECPDLGVMTRGTNLGTATDLSSDATPLRELYAGGFDFDPPPNSPWAALNGDFGIELAGYMSRIVELPPGKKALYRFYIHDPWWLNSPWLDRYERQPHDIYLPLSIARIDDAGNTEPPDNISLLSLDDSYGKMTDAVPNEVNPHLIRAWNERPDSAGPVVWLYPFDELHDAMFGTQPAPERLFHTDWFAREALNDGTPINTVVSTRVWRTLGTRVHEVFADRIIVSPAPFDSAGENLLLAWADADGKLLVYGPLDRAPRLRERLGLRDAPPVDGEFTVTSTLPSIDTIEQAAATRYFHQNVMCGGPLTEAPAKADGTTVVARNAAGEVRALHARAGTIDWLRGPLPMRLPKGEHLPVRDDAATTFPLSSLVRQVLKQHGWSITFTAQTQTQRHPVIALHRQTNGWFFSTYLPDTTVDLTLRTPFGAPLLLGMETWIRNGASTYRLPRASRLESRVFVDQADGWLKYIEELPGQIGVTRRSWVHGLKNATVRFFPPTGSGPVTFFLNPKWPYIAGETVPLREIATPQGPMLETTQPVTGTVLISW
ncbi:MAG: hypothetical protein WC205_08700 [Opitutaceae bacterium]|jgi:hypothetical protein